jgi:phosphopantetheinyl transferase (holo-ACP synthase)
LQEIVSIGYDLEEVFRFSKYINEYHRWDSLLDDLFTAREQHNYGQGSDAALRYTLSFCTKEAFYKAISCSWMQDGPDWKEIELIFHAEDTGCFKLMLSGKAKECYQNLGDSFKLSLDEKSGVASSSIIIYKNV